MINKENLRIAVLDAAQQLFISKGYENVGMRDIALAVGKQPTQVYRLKLSKSDILAELILQLNSKQIERVPKLLSSIKGDKLYDKVCAYIERLYEFDIEYLPIRSVGAAHGWSWSAEYETKNLEQVRQLIAPIASWIAEAGLRGVEARCIGMFSIYYVGFREAVIRQSSAKECLESIKPSLSYFCR